MAGNTGIPSAGFTLTVDNLPPTKPEPPTITDDANPITGIITNGITNDTTPTFSGTGSAGDVIAIYLDGRTEPLGTATVGADGTRALRQPTRLIRTAIKSPSPPPIRRATSARIRMPSPQASIRRRPRRRLSPRLMMTSAMSEAISPPAR